MRCGVVRSVRMLRKIWCVVTGHRMQPRATLALRMPRTRRMQIWRRLRQDARLTYQMHRIFLLMFIKVWRGSGSGRIGSIWTWPRMRQEWKLASPPGGLLEPDESLIQCSALPPVHLMSILPKSWPVHFARWFRKDKGTCNCLPPPPGPGARGTAIGCLPSTGAELRTLLASRLAFYIYFLSLVSLL